MTETADHDGLRTRLENLERHAVDQLGLLAAFADVHDFLRLHFAHEEGPDGLFALVREHAPAYEEQAEVLQREHAALLASAQFIAARATTLSHGQLGAEVAEFVALVRAHEIAEGVLYQEACAP